MFDTFIKATNEFCTLERYVPAPYFRQNIEVKGEIKSAVLSITGLGFYEAHINGKDITKGILAPYISNPSHFIYYDKYDITQKLHPGKNVLGVILGNGYINNVGGYTWDYDKAGWRSAPMLSFEIDIEYSDGKKEKIESSENTKCTASPILFDDERHGEYYDARLEIPLWDKEDFDDKAWNNSIIAKAPCGEIRLCEADAIKERGRLYPVSISKCKDGFIYDFGTNNAGLALMNIKNTTPGQKITTRFFELVKDGEPYYANIRFADERTADFQKNIYYCRGTETETHIPRFTYEGFRYIFVSGITKEQATKELFTYLLYNSEMKQIGHFSCDNDIVNKIQDATVRADYSNFYYFPTDCPQREKNGWTADASLSAEQMLYNITPERGYKEWMRNIYKALNEKGQLPGIIPTAGWGYHWGNGPSWDIVIANLPYNTYRYRGDIEILKENAEPLNRYLHYIYSRLNDKNLLEIGLGDWCEPDKGEDKFRTPLVITDSFSALDIIRKAIFIFKKTDKKEYLAFAEDFEKKLSEAIGKHLIDYNTCTVFGNTQSAQSMGIYFGFFTNEQKPKAMEKLLELIRVEDGHCYCGVVGAGPFYKVLAENGYVDLAFDIITRTDFPSYGNWIARGATSLWETYRREGDTINSLNHHFWGFVSEWFYKYLAGITINPTGDDSNDILIKPLFPKKLSEVNADYCPENKGVKVSLKRINEQIELEITLSGNFHGKVVLPSGYTFEDNSTEKTLKLGVNRFVVR